MEGELDLTTKDTTKKGNTTLQTVIPAALLVVQVVQAALLADLEAMIRERDLAIADTIERRDTTLLTVTQVTLWTDPAALQIIHCHLKDIIITVDVITIIIDITPETAVSHILMEQVCGTPSLRTLKKSPVNTGGKTNRSANI